MTDPAPIAILTTGGTIDKVYALSGDLEIGPPAVAGILDAVVTPTPILVERVLAKDSLDLTDDDRDALARAVARTAADRIVITHGTDTMTDTAESLAGRVPEGKTIVLTGALQPASMNRSDAAFNLGFAIAAAQTSPPGVYVAMSARVFPASTVVKDRSTGAFVQR